MCCINLCVYCVVYNDQQFGNFMLLTKKIINNGGLADD